MKKFMAKYLSLPACYLVIAVIAFSLPTDSRADPTKASIAMRALDEVLGNDLLQPLGLTFTRQVSYRDHTRTYTYSSEDEKTGKPLAVVTIALKAGGRLIRQVVDRDGASETRETASEDRSLSIGATAIDRGALISPDGVVSEIWFRTIDSLFDVKVTVFEASSSVPRGELSSLSVAEAVAVAYDKTMK